MLAISVDHIYSHNVFAAALGTLPYPLLADWHKTTVKAYGVLNEKDGTAIRSCFVVDKEGKLRYCNTKFDANKRDMYEEVFSVCEECKGELK